ncbi:unnamed protein product [Spirodela intermedia]|uniref:NAC domain-containing protein n=1 Tax=Spirodela intermedia TaxID=51605 RepID=A0A7I8K359_SPIIN|nr:unnamed protein product [Spirodela intermedia]
MNLPGFRFHPTEEELLDYYLKGAIQGKKLGKEVIATGNIYRHDPWELPMLARNGGREWYFFVPRDKRNSSGGRPNRTTARGFWKATGTDRAIRSLSDQKRLLGLRKTLVFYQGRAPRGRKTDWIMNEYRLVDATGCPPPAKEDVVLCKIYRKAKTIKELKSQVDAMEEEVGRALGSLRPADASSSSAPAASLGRGISPENPPTIPLTEGEKEAEVTSVPLPSEPAGIANQGFLLELETPEVPSPKLELETPEVPSPKLEVETLEVPSPNSELDWMGNYFFDQLLIPCVDYWSFYLSNAHNFGDDGVLSAQPPKDDVVPDLRTLFEPNQNGEDFVNL